MAHKRQHKNRYLDDPVTNKPMYWWFGSIVDECHWILNEELKNHSRFSAAGWGKRYRICIFGRDTQKREDGVADQELLTAEAWGCANGGSGHRGYADTISLEQGSYVAGFYLDGEEGRQPVICWTSPNCPQTDLFKGDTPERFIPRSGYFGCDNLGNNISTKDMFADPVEICESKTVDGGCTNVNQVLQKDDASIDIILKKTYQCEGPKGPLKGIQGAIQRLLAIIQLIKKRSKSALGAVSDITSNIRSVVNSAAKFITGLVKLIFSKMRGFIVQKIDQGLKDIANLLPPNLRQSVAETAVKGTDTINCVFNKIISGLLDLVLELLDDLIDKFILAPMCAAEQFLGKIIGSVLNEITGAIESVLSSIEGLVDAASGILDSVFDIFDIVVGVLNFLKCDETPDCQFVEKWNWWTGDKEADAVSDFLGETLKNISKGLGEVGSKGCNTSQLPCGAPSISFSGGGGSGLAGNPIISTAGEIMGIDITNFGSGYTSTPSISITDGCGKGSGATASLLTSSSKKESGIDPVTTSDTGEEITITGAIILSPGEGYISAPDGSTGGNGKVLSEPEDTIIVDENGNYEVYPPDTTIPINSGSTIYLPQNTRVPVYNEDGNYQGSIGGLGQINPILINNPNTDDGRLIITTPKNTSNPLPNREEEGTTGEQNIIPINEFPFPGTGPLPEIKIGLDFTSDPPENPSVNDQYTNTQDGIGNWPGFIGEDVKEGDTTIFDGNEWILNPSVRSGIQPIGDPIGNGNETLNPPVRAGIQPIGDPISDEDIILDGVFIEDGGVNYQDEDAIEITPNNGVEMRPVFDDRGSLIDIIITNPGSKFDNYPKIAIKSTTGFNANILPIFKLRKRNEDPDSAIRGQRIISVIDCVGKNIPN